MKRKSQRKRLIEEYLSNNSNNAVLYRELRFEVKQKELPAKKIEQSSFIRSFNRTIKQNYYKAYRTVSHDMDIRLIALDIYFEIMELGLISPGITLEYLNFVLLGNDCYVFVKMGNQEFIRVCYRPLHGRKIYFCKLSKSESDSHFSRVRSKLNIFKCNSQGELNAIEDGRIPSPIYTEEVYIEKWGVFLSNRLSYMGFS